MRLTAAETAMVIAAMGIGSTLLAALLSQKMSGAQERARWKHEQGTRWHGALRESYLGYLMAADEVTDSSRNYADALEKYSETAGGSGTDVGLADLKNLNALLGSTMAAWDGFIARFEEIQAIASDPVVEASKVLNAAGTQLILPALKSDLGSLDISDLNARVQRGRKAFGTALTELRSAVRHELRG